MRQPLLPVLAATIGLIAATEAHATVTLTTFGASQWGASDATLGVAGYTIENFEGVTLAGGLRVARSGGLTGNFAATGVLPSTSIFDPSTDPALVSGLPLRAFSRGVWDGTHVLINHPGPGFVSPQDDWYSDSGNWKNLTFTLPAGVTSVGFSLEQLDAPGDTLLVNGVAVTTDLYSLLFAASDTDTQSGITFSSRNGYLRIDSDQEIQTVALIGANGDGYAIDHFAFNVPEPASVAVLGIALAGLAGARRRLG